MREVRRRQVLSGLAELIVVGAAAGLGGVGVAGCDAARNRVADRRVPPGTALWHFRTGAGSEIGLAAADGMVYARGTAPPVHAAVTFGINANTGQQTWRTHRSALDFSYAAGADAVFGFAPGRGVGYTVAALGATTGRPLWTYPLGGASGLGGPSGASGLGGPSEASMLVDYWLTCADGLLYAPTAQPGLVALDPRTGRRVWSRALTAGWAVPGDGAVYASSAAGQLLALDAATGTALWQIGTKLPLSALAIAAGVVCGLANGHVYAFGAATGTALWSTDLGAGAMDAIVPAVAGGTVFFIRDQVTGSPFSIWALDARTGKRAWTRGAARGQLLRSLCAADDVLYLGMADGTLLALAAATGRTLWSQRLGALVRHIAAADDAVYAADAGGVVHAFRS
jgi:outer membrane protein assembly factor BamB